MAIIMIHHIKLISTKYEGVQLAAIVLVIDPASAEAIVVILKADISMPTPKTVYVPAKTTIVARATKTISLSLRTSFSVALVFVAIAIL